MRLGCTGTTAIFVLLIVTIERTHAVIVIAAGHREIVLPGEDVVGVIPRGGVPEIVSDAIFGRSPEDCMGVAGHSWEDIRDLRVDIGVNAGPKAVGDVDAII